ncbi:UNVERIFIED_CONTAM: hypothetical protein Sradi_2561500 [Sesamum radiatum]|uniref:DUF4283 domain-containing protein n=1 Tax=Sesamum radiatum TaxID=300843 RepID=A0AAW2S410_SESRA
MASFMLNPDEFPPLTRGNSPELTRHSQESAQSRAQTTATAQPKQPNFQNVFLANQNPSPIGTVNTINGRPTITFSDDETHSLAAAFRFALVGKFSHGSPPFSQLHQLLAKTGIKGTFTCLKWSPTFSTAHESPIVPIWASFPELPAHLFKKDVLFSLAKFIGTPLQIADSTFNQSNLSKARVCIEIDLLKPLVEEIDINIFGSTIVQKIVYEQVPYYCSLCKHIGHQDSECYSKGDIPKPPSRSRGNKRADVEDKQKRNVGDRYVPVSVSAFDQNETAHADNDTQANVNDPEISEQEPYANEVVVGGLEIEAHDEINYAENVVYIAENESVTVVGNVEHAIVTQDSVENEVRNEHAFSENETLVEHAIVYTIENENEKVEGAIGALILRPDNFLCELKKRASWFKVDNALRLFDTFKRFGKVMKGIEQDVEKVIKRNGLSLRSAILFQKCVLIFDRVSQLYLKPLDVRSPPIATRTRRRKKGMNLTEPMDIHYF